MVCMSSILVVDDEPDITALVAYHLAKHGYHVTTASDGCEAVRLAVFGSTAKKEDARYRIPRVKSGEVERLNTVVVDMVLYEQRRVVD